MTIWAKKVKEPVKGVPPGRAIQAEGTVGAKALRQKADPPGSQSSKEARSAEPCEQG